ncbi:MAG: M48 family metalloprotease [Planctomycetota bacterium]
MLQAMMPAILKGTAGFVLLWALGCCTDPVNGKLYFCFRDMSSGEEEEIGARYAPNFVAQSGGPYPDRKLHEYLNEIVIEKMAKKSERPHLNWTFEILNTSQINAFALPGGQVFVTRGLLARLETEAQFAHLMGHEVAHVTHRHAMRGQGRRAMLGILVGPVAIVGQSIRVLTGNPDSPLVLASLVGALGSIPFLKYNRDQELEADQTGIDYAVRAGYDPREAIKTFQMFLEWKKEMGRRDNFFVGLIQTHPLDRKRIKKINAYIKRKYPDIAAGERKDLIISREPWDGFLETIKKEQASYAKCDKALELVARSKKEKKPELLNAADKQLQEAKQELPDAAQVHVAFAVVALERQESEIALEQLAKAIALDDKEFEAHLIRGTLHRMADRRDPAMKDLLIAHDVFPMNPFPCYQLGKLSEAMDQNPSASGWYVRAIQRAPRGSEVRKLSRKRLNVLDKRKSLSTF